MYTYILYIYIYIYLYIYILYMGTNTIHKIKQKACGRDANKA